MIVVIGNDINKYSMTIVFVSCFPGFNEKGAAFSNLGDREFVLRIRLLCLQKQILGKKSRSNFKELFIVLTGHRNIHIIVPGNIILPPE